ncbi:phosphoadenosine phosphosulfate reductase family protein [Vulcanococcus limneticus]|uniref:phosphoadenosine phosphosulfate reductase family protein n=1 Tax=Vulcanococcus limneticus TaxID=2170428 RepID=UPI00398BD505
MPRPVRHILGLSGGKDSTALAIYMRDRVPEIEYFFCDTGAELPETYEYLSKLEVYLGKEVVRLSSDRTFDHWLKIYRGTLPSPSMRWCTKVMKIDPLEKWIGSDKAVSYVGLRADEASRKGYASLKKNILSVFPFIEDGLELHDIEAILIESGIGKPSYYDWRSRSGCYFCFYQRKSEWIGLHDNHPDLFAKSVEYEQKKGFEDTASETQYNWSQGETLSELLARRNSIRERNRERHSAHLIDILDDNQGSDDFCSACHL